MIDHKMALANLAKTPHLLARRSVADEAKTKVLLHGKPESLDVEPLEERGVPSRIAQLFDRNHSSIQMLVHHPCLRAAHRATPAIRKSYHTPEILESYGIRNQPPIALCERSTGEWVQKQDLTPDACWHKIPGPYVFRLEESMAIWKQITCPVRWVAGRDSWVIRDFATRPGDWEARRACFTNLDEQWIEDADHMLHHDQPAEVARIIEAAFPQGSAN